MYHPDLDDLSLFRHVAEAGSITGGARQANIALAAASTRIRGMEERLGTTLLSRGRQGVALTPAGHALLTHARGLLAQAERMRDEMGLFADGGGGQVRLLCNTNALTEFLPEALGRFLIACPGTTIDLQERLSDEIVRLVAQGVADLGIVADTVDMGTLATFPFRADRLVVVTSAHDPLASRPAIGFEQILQRDLVGLDASSALQRFLSERAARMGRRLRLRVQLRSFDSVCLMVEAGAGIGIVPETTAHRARRSMDLRVVTLEDEWASRQLRICIRDYEALSPIGRRLVDHLRTE